MSASVGREDALRFGLRFVRPLPASVTVGVGNNPDAIPFVRCTNGARRDALPFRIVPERGQVPENLAHWVEPSSVAKSLKAETWDVLHEHESRS